MAYLHTVDFEKHLTDFKDILTLEKTIVESNKTINEKLNEVKQTYQYLVKNNSKKIFLFCLDAFFFQYKNHTNEYENLSKSAILIVNRMYGDYYKLYNIMVLQLREKNIPLKSITESKKFSVYKDLDPYYPYSMNEITNIHNSIMEILLELQSYHNSLEKSAYNYSQTSHVGLSIMNFIHTLQYENMLVREQIHLYVNYLSFFHNSHKTHLQKLIRKIETFQEEMEEDITNTNIQPFSQNNNSIEPIDLECVFAITDNLKIDNITTILEDSDKIVKDSESIIQQIENIIITTEEHADPVLEIADIAPVMDDQISQSKEPENTKKTQTYDDIPEVSGEIQTSEETIEDSNSHEIQEINRIEQYPENTENL
jgi:hypothetical protein